MQTHELILQSTSNERYTQAKYLNAAYEVMGGIDLDPASCEQANQTVKAARFYTKTDNGLRQTWFGRVWLNPPYGRENGSQKKIWSHRLIAEYEAGRVEQAILLVTASTGDRWFQPLWAYTLCFPDHRVDFDSPSGPLTAGNTGSSVFVYFGEKIRTFVEVFQRFGPVVTPDRVVRQADIQMSLSFRREVAA